MQDWSERLDVHGLRLNIKKTENMECGPQIDGTIRVTGQPLNKVTEFKYLGSLIRGDGVAPIVDKMREDRLRWYGHIIRSGDDTVAKIAYNLSPPGWRPRGRPKKRWLDHLAEDKHLVNITPDDALDRAKWQKACKQADPVQMQDTR